MKKTVFSISILLNGLVSAQVTTATNFSLPGTPFLGWNGGGISRPLDIRNNFAAQPIHFYAGGSTPLFHRMTINGTTGYIGISPVGHFATNSPQSMIHMYEPSSSPGPTMGWRDWMRTGVFMDERTNAMYLS